MTGVMARFPRSEALLAESLAAAAFATRRTGHGVFRFRLHDAPGPEGCAALEDPWARLAIDGAHGTAWPEATDLLDANAGLPGVVKWAWAHGLEAPALVADCWLGDDAAAARAEVQAGCSNLALAAPSGCVTEEATDPGPAERDLVAELGAAGWKANRRDDGSLAIDLDTGRDYAQARLTRGPGPRLVCRAEVAAVEEVDGDADAREALARLLLGASATLRLARGASAATGGRRSYRFEVGLAADAGAASLERALTALTVACATYGPEARALTRPELARIYVAVRGGSRAAEEMRRARLGVAGQGG